MIRLTRNTSIFFERKLADCWIGVYWRYDARAYRALTLSGPMRENRILDVWLCLVPCLPIHFRRVQIVAIPEAGSY